MYVKIYIVLIIFHAVQVNPSLVLDDERASAQTDWNHVFQAAFKEILW